jgi:hypothetical protein
MDHPGFDGGWQSGYGPGTSYTNEPMEQIEDRVEAIKSSPMGKVVSTEEIIPRNKRLRT